VSGTRGLHAGPATAAIREAARRKRGLVELDAVARVIEAHPHGDTAAAMSIT
jgi:hypothetical protein